MKKPEIVYHYRGDITRMGQWRHGYARTKNDQTREGVVWLTKTESQDEARSLGGRAVFYLDGRRMDR